MKKPAIFKKSIATIIVAFVMLTSCESLKTAIYDQHSYEQSISLKVEALDLMTKANQPYSEYKETVSNYLMEFEKLKEYEKNKENNQLSYEMLKKIGSPENNLLGGFLKRWKEKNTISNFMINESKGQVKEAFDVLIKYELKKEDTEITKYLNQ